MQREIIPFTTEEAWLKLRTHDLTSSDVPCLFNAGYQTYEQLFQAKLHKFQVKIEPNERMDWGVAIQDSIALEFARKNNWTLLKKTEYIRIPELRIGSSFDFQVTKNMLPEFILEIKNVSLDSYKQWIKGFSIEMSPYIEIQIQHQMLVSGINKCIVGALIGGCEGKLIAREANPKIQQAILSKSAEFWRKIDENRHS